MCLQRRPPMPGFRPSRRVVLLVFLMSTLVAAELTAQSPAPAASRTPAVGGGSWTQRTPDGQPDLQGTWINFDSTPFETAAAQPAAPAPAAAAAGANVGPASEFADHNHKV